MPRTTPVTLTCGLLLAAALNSSGSAQTPPAPAMAPPSILPTVMGEAIDRDVARLRAATERLKLPDAAIAAGYAAEP